MRGDGFDRDCVRHHAFRHSKRFPDGLQKRLFGGPCGISLVSAAVPPRTSGLFSSPLSPHIKIRFPETETPVRERRFDSVRPTTRTPRLEEWWPGHTPLRGSQAAFWRGRSVDCPLKKGQQLEPRKAFSRSNHQLLIKSSPRHDVRMLSVIKTCSSFDRECLPWDGLCCFVREAGSQVTS